MKAQPKKLVPVLQMLAILAFIALLMMAISQSPINTPLISLFPVLQF